MDNPQQVVSELRIRIQNLFPVNGLELSREMDSLKTALLENPAACTLLTDEDIGACVSHLRRITGMALASASSKEKKPRAAKKVALTKEEMDAALDDM